MMDTFTAQPPVAAPSPRRPARRPGKLGLDSDTVDRCQHHAAQIADSVIAFASQRSTVSIERAILRLMGVSGADAAGVPLANVLVRRLQDADCLADGVALHVGLLMERHALPLAQVLDGLIDGRLRFQPLDGASPDAAQALARQACAARWRAVRARLAERDGKRAALGEREGTLAYVLTATGDVYEDVRHAQAVANHGGDIVAVIRSTAQSLLDYVPYGPTREGYGGTYATQENFRIMRTALDDWSEENGRYVRLSSFASGLCMPEISAMGALEGLDNMVNDALYGILYRDINMERTLVDQAFSREITAAAGIVINTGEDNYLRTADAVTAAPSIVASQMINFQTALRCGMAPGQIGVGNAFEVEPTVENSLLIEWSHALLSRELFPHCPVKYMPPTRFMNGNVFRTHACDTLFNLVTTATQQGIQTIGVPTEGMFTPHIHDRVLALECVNYVRTAAKDLYDEIEFSEDGLVKSQARATLNQAEVLLQRVSASRNGLFGAIEEGMFGDVRRARAGGKGRDGVFIRAAHYLNPFSEIFQAEKA